MFDPFSGSDPVNIRNVSLKIPTPLGFENGEHKLGSRRPPVQGPCSSLGPFTLPTTLLSSSIPLTNLSQHNRNQDQGL